MAANEWLRDYFEFHGDFMPKSAEIHLEPINRCTIYNDYCEELTKNGTPTLSITKFLLLWRNGYPLVKIREYKAVTGDSY